MTYFRERQTPCSGRYVFSHIYEIEGIYFFKASCPKGLKMFTAREILDLVPLQALITASLQYLLSTVSDPILCDCSVLVHMTMLVILRPKYCQSPDPIVQRIIAQLWTMLRRYLTNTLSCPSRVDHSLALIQYCLNTLPIMLEQNKDVFSKFV